MALRCAVCLKQLYTVDRLFQIFTKRCQAGYTIGLEQDSEPELSKCYTTLLKFYRTIRRYQIYRTAQYNGLATRFTYYCAQCGPKFKDVQLFLGTSFIKYNQSDGTHPRSLYNDDSSENESILVGTPSRNHSFVRENVRASIDGYPPLIPRPSLGSPSAMSRGAESIELRALSEDDVRPASAPQLEQGEYPFMSNQLGVQSLAAAASGANSMETVALRSSQTSLRSYGSSFDDEAVSQAKPHFYGFYYERLADIWEQAENTAWYDRDLASKGKPALYIALYILSASFREFVAEAEKENRTHIQKLYTQTHDWLNSCGVIEHWLGDAKTRLQALKQHVRALGRVQVLPFYLERVQHLTISAVEGLLVQTDRSCLLRPSYARWSTWVLLCVFFMSMLGLLIHVFTKDEPAAVVEPTVNPSTTTTITPLPDEPCHVTNECLVTIYRQIADNLTILKEHGLSTVGRVYRHCNNFRMFEYFRAVCFANDPRFTELLQDNDPTQDLIDYFNNAAGTMY